MALAAATRVFVKTHVRPPPDFFATEAAGLDCGIPSFVIAKAVEHKGQKGTEAVDWFLNPGNDGVAPLHAFQQTVIDASEQWRKRNATGQSGIMGFPS